MQTFMALYALPTEESGHRFMAALFRDVTETPRAARPLWSANDADQGHRNGARRHRRINSNYRFVNESFKRLLNGAGPICVGQKVGPLDLGRWESTRPSIDRAPAVESLSIEFTAAAATTPSAKQR